jgi:hypothetical protein
VAVNVKDGRAVLFSMDNVRFPEFVVERLSHVSKRARSVRPMAQNEENSPRLCHSCAAQKHAEAAAAQ